MNSPYMGKFRVSQQYKKGHTGLDLVGIDSKEIHSIVNGVVDYAGWEFYFGHLSEIRVKVGQTVKITDVIGVEGSTGYSTGSHCHIEARKKPGVAYAGTVNISEITGIPNVYGGVYDDGYRPGQNNIPAPEQPKPASAPQKDIKTIGNCSMLNLRTSAGYGNNIYKAVKAGTQVELIGEEKGWAKIQYEGKVLYCGKNYLK